MQRLKLWLTALTVAALGTALIGSVGASAADTAAPAAAKAKKCKKLKGKKKKKCLKKQAAQNAPAAAAKPLTATTMKVECTVGCAPYLTYPVNAFNDTNITVKATFGPAVAGTPIALTYKSDYSTSVTETINTDGAGTITKNIAIGSAVGPMLGYDNEVKAAFAGDATRSPSSASLIIRISD